MRTNAEDRPAGIAGLTLLFLFGTAASFVSLVSLLSPGSFLEPIWRLNPRAREGFGAMGSWALVLMCVVCVASASTAIGLWRGARWGYWFAVVMLAVNLLGDVANVLLGTERKALIGVPIVIVILVYLRSKRVKEFFDISTRG
ncbi:MAG: DUF2127 domain-containing protein [Pyrinomonadaceae bacterium]